MICLVDTSVLCNLLLPLASIIETGNHIAQVKNGSSRRDLADRFYKMIQASLGGTAPWTPIHFFDDSWLRDWISEFPDHAMREIGLGDLSIIKEHQHQKTRHKGHRVLIWSYDDHLRGYDTGER